MIHRPSAEEFRKVLRAGDLKPVHIPRRAFLLGSTALTGLLGVRASAQAQDSTPPPIRLKQPDRDQYLTNPTDEPWKYAGAGPSELGRRSPFVHPKRQIEVGGGRIHETGSNTDWREIIGTITPSDLCYERHHAGVPLVDPDKWRLLVHGMVERPMIFTLQDLMRLPMERRSYVWECQGNGNGYRPSGGKIDEEVTILDTLGRSSAAEWIGVPVRTIMEMVGVHAEARWALVEGMDAAAMARSGDIEKLRNDAYLMYGQNGEALRPENGYPVRLLMPGYEGNTSVKWIRRIQFGRSMFQMREETSKYADHLPDGRTWQYSVMNETRSHITFPSGGMHLPYRGPMEIRGIAWSGRGAVARVEVSTDGGTKWTNARLHDPVARQMATMFTLPWQWDGHETTIKSRAVDDTGNRQETHEYVARYGPRGVSYNAIQSWRIHPNGAITHAWA